MKAIEIVEAWDRSLRDSDWNLARSLLADDATYTVPDAPEDERISCNTPDEVIEFLRSLKGELPDVQVVEWEPLGDHVLARLRQPAFGDEAEWYQVLSVHDDLIVRMEDYSTRGAALAAVRAD
jgi:hypothetical protein